MTQRYFLQLAYQGTHYQGWQWQRNAPASVQAALQEALSKVLHQSMTVTGCGRTDAGVHASNYYVHFHYEPTLPERFIPILNRTLPDDIAVQKAWPVSEKSHARFSATARRYHYYFHTDKQPAWRETSTYLADWKNTLNFQAMNAAAQLLTQYNDFRAFCKAPDRHTHTRCTVVKAHFCFTTQPYFFTITANRFVRGMVRLLMAQLWEVGRGKITVSDFEEMLKTGERPRYLVFAPPQGLYLTRVSYPFLTDDNEHSNNYTGLHLPG